MNKTIYLHSSLGKQARKPCPHPNRLKLSRNVLFSTIMFMFFLVLAIISAKGYYGLRFIKAEHTWMTLVPGGTITNRTYHKHGESCSVMFPSIEDITYIESAVKGYASTEQLPRLSTKENCIVEYDCKSKKWTVLFKNHECSTYILYYRDEPNNVFKLKQNNTFKEINIRIRSILSTLSPASITNSSFLLMCSERKFVARDNYSNCKISEIPMKIDMKCVANKKAENPVKMRIHGTKKKDKNIHLIYISFLSRFEFLHGFSLISETFNHFHANGNNIFDFTRYQSTSIKESVSLRRLFFGKTEKGNNFSKSNSLFALAYNSSLRMKLIDYSCQDIVQRGDLLSAFDISDVQYRTCHCDILNVDLCQAVHGQFNLSQSDHNVTSMAELFLIDDDRHDQASLVIHVLNYMDFRSVLGNYYLAKNLEKFLSLKQVGDRDMTIVISDVGIPFKVSHRTTLFSTSQTWNPFFLLLLPHSSVYSEDRFIKEMRENEHNFITIFEIHNFLASLIKGRKNPTKECRKNKICSRATHTLSGFHFNFSQFLRFKNCSNSVLDHPSMCICDNQSSRHKNDTIEVAFAEFLVGSINRLFEEASISSSILVRSCHFNGVKFSDIEVQRTEKKIKRHFAVQIRNFNTRSDPFTVEVVMVTNFIAVGIVNTSIESLHVREGVLLSEKVFDMLCPSFTENLLQARNKNQLISSFSSSFGVLTQPIDLHMGCLYLLLRDYKTSLTFEATNMCSDKKYILWFTVESKQQISLTPLPVISHILPFKIRYLTSTVYVSFVDISLYLRYKTSFSVVEI